LRAGIVIIFVQSLDAQLKDTSEIVIPKMAFVNVFMIIFRSYLGVKFRIIFDNYEVDL
jgi:hypothetical protein